jgi:hypothetical protein
VSDGMRGAALPGGILYEALLATMETRRERRR